MGLCKCPHRKVTTQFCYEHKVNVCEHCTVESHPKCIVQSYVKWLDDCDYDPTCLLCKRNLAEGECIRLLCYDVFHRDCIDNYASQLPPHTAPAGYACPSCRMGIFPQSNEVSPVADRLRAALGNYNWAREGLGLPLIVESSKTPSDREENQSSSSAEFPSTSNSPHYNNDKVSSISENNQFLSKDSSMDIHSTRPEPYGASFPIAHYTSPRKMYDSTECDTYRPSVIDHDEDKYKRRSAIEWINRWFKSRTILGGSRRRDPKVIYKKWIVLAILGLIALCTVILLFLRLGRASADADPLLDLHLNPNIRVEDDIGDLRAQTAKSVHKDNLKNVQNLDSNEKLKRDVEVPG